MKQLLTGKVALITGATSGIGRETARLFAQEGADLILTGRREQALQTLSQELEVLGVRCRYLAGDAGSSAFAEELFAYALQSLGRVDVLVCSAGMALRTPTLDMPVSEWEQVMAVNLTFPMRLSQLAVQQFLAQGGGKIVMVSSTAAKNVNLGASPSYGASKAGMVYLTRHLAAEFGSRSIYANAICPGPVDTEITQTWTPEHRQKVLPVAAARPDGHAGGYCKLRTVSCQLYERLHKRRIHPRQRRTVYGLIRAEDARHG